MLTLAASYGVVFVLVSGILGFIAIIILIIGVATLIRRAPY